jgi:hypothetical protein
MAKRKKRGKAGDKTICLPIEEGINYAELVEDREAYRKYLDGQIRKHPELFPEGIEQGYRFHGLVESLRQELKTRRIYLSSSQEAYQIRPDCVMPYMSEKTEKAAKGLYLRKHGLSYDGIAYVLGGSEMHWYHLCQGMGRGSIVGTTVKRWGLCPPISMQTRSIRGTEEKKPIWR